MGPSHPMSTATDVDFIEDIPTMRLKSRSLKAESKKIGFVPTMGYLHEAHASLIKEAKKRADTIVLSIFVNPTQFGPTEDLENYPRDLERDARIAEENGVDVIFHPSAEEMYPEGYSTYVTEVNLSQGLCGRSRPGHFRGVATIVLKLFNIVGPDIAVFGEKDYQQLMVIKKMVSDLDLDIEIIGSPIVRDKDGLALSSRNEYLTEEERRQALAISSSLVEAREAIAAGERSSRKIREMISKDLLLHKDIRIEYVEIIDARTLAHVKEITPPALIAVAAVVGKTRLIDNAIIK